MNICRFEHGSGDPHVGLINDDRTVRDLGCAGITSLENLLEAEDIEKRLGNCDLSCSLSYALSEVRLLAPIERQEVWAAGVTYLRSKTARMNESDFSATAYDRVYEAERPEIFFKAMPEKVVGPGEPVGIRSDARWSVPEPELALVLNSRGSIIGCTIGNDMSSRDIEGDNLLYLPQAKIYSRSCALGPWLKIGCGEEEMRGWKVAITISRASNVAFYGETSVGQIKRNFTELANYLFRSQSFPRGAVLLTGTGIVPPDSFTLAEGDEVEISVSGIGALRNSVVLV